MKKAVILHAGLLMAALGASGAAYAGGHWVCPPGGVAFSIGGASSTTSGAACATGGAASSIGATPSCWWKDDSIEYRGNADAKPVEELLKEANEQATKDAAALDGNELIEADATAGINADIATVRAQAFRDRLKQVEAEDKKKGVKHRGKEHRGADAYKHYSAYWEYKPRIPSRPYIPSGRKEVTSNTTK